MTANERDSKVGVVHAYGCFQKEVIFYLLLGAFASEAAIIL